MALEKNPLFDNADGLLAKYQEMTSEGCPYASLRVAKNLLLRSAELGNLDARYECVTNHIHYLHLRNLKIPAANQRGWEIQMESICVDLSEEQLGLWLNSLISSENPDRLKYIALLYHDEELKIWSEEEREDIMVELAKAGDKECYREVRFEADDENLTVEKFLEIAESAAATGLEAANYDLGRRYLLGDGVEMSVEKAESHFLKGYRHGSYPSDELLLVRRMRSLGTDSLEELFDYLSVEAENGTPEDQYLLSVCYNNRWGIKERPDFHTARERLKYWSGKAAEMDYVPALHMLETFADSDEERAAIQERLIALGDVDTCISLAGNYYSLYLFAEDEGNRDGNMNPENLELALEYVRMAEELGYSGTMHREISDTLAEYRRSEQLNFPETMEMQDVIKECLRWRYVMANPDGDLLKYALGKGVPEAMHLYAEMQPLCEAFPYYLEAAESGFVPSMKKVSDAFLNGDGTESSEEAALRWLIKAAEAGDVDAQFELGRHYELGDCIGKDELLALKWYSEAAEQLDIEAYRAGTCLGENRV